MGEKTFDIEGLIYSIKKRWWMLALVLLVASGLGIFKATRMDETYTAKVKIFSGKTEQITDRYSKQELMEYSALMETYIQIIKTTDFMNNVSNKSGTGISAAELINGVEFGVTEGVPILEISYTSADHDTAKNIVKTISSEFSSGVEEIILGVHTKVIEEVQVITNSPNKTKVILIAVILGIIIALGIVFVLDYLDNTIRDKSDLENILKTPVIGELPYRKIGKGSKDFVVKDAPRSISSECYRSLRTGFLYASIDKGIKTLVITSSEAGEGKSTVSCNFAYVMSQSDKRVLIIDCDLRRPTLHKKFSISNIEGLTNYLIDKNELSDVIKNVDKNLDVITAGEIPPNPTDILGSNKMQELIKDLELEYDLIILDTPPVRAVTDGQVLAGKVDGTLFLIRADKTKLDSVISGHKELEKVNANIVGIVVNGEATDRKGSYYYHYSEKKVSKA